MKKIYVVFDTERKTFHAFIDLKDVAKLISVTYITLYRDFLKYSTVSRRHYFIQRTIPKPSSRGSKTKSSYFK